MRNITYLKRGNRDDCPQIESLKSLQGQLWDAPHDARIQRSPTNYIYL